MLFHVTQFETDMKHSREVSKQAADGTKPLMASHETTVYR
jgi:hypothetical protein